MAMIQEWKIDIFRNVGSLDEPDMQWVNGESRFYWGEIKSNTDSDLCDIDGKRRNAVFIGMVSEDQLNSRIKTIQP